MDLRQRALQHVDEVRPELEQVSALIHAHPELGHEEHQAAALLCERLERHGFLVERGLAGLPTAFRARYERPRPGGEAGHPALGFIAEYDALPELGHACGHNLIAASGLGAALATARLVDELGGAVWLFGTPAEEFDGAKVPLAEQGVFDVADAVIMLHPESVWMVNTTALALDALQFEFFGRTAHAAATPWEGVNALDAMVLFFNGIGALRQQLRDDARVHGIITKGGTYPNIIPDHTVARFFVRSRQRADLDRVSAQVKACAEGAALATGCRLAVTAFERSLDNLVHNPPLDALLARSLASLGVTDLVAADAEPGSSDFGTLSHRVPAAYFYCPTAPAGMALHTPEFAALAADPAAFEPLLLAVKAMVLCAHALLSDPGLLAAVRAAHPPRAGASARDGR